MPESKKWVSAKDLVVGDTVLLSNRNKTKVEAVRAIHYEEAQTTYNFEVEDFHTYYVGAGVLVHNLNCHTERGLARQTQAKMTNKRSIISNGNNRIPDYLNVKNGVMGEAKSVGKLSYTRQLRDMFEYASNNGMKMFLKVEKWTQMSKPLQMAIKTFNVFVNVF